MKKKVAQQEKVATQQSTERAASPFPALEEAVLQMWEKEDVFVKTLAQTKEGPRFVFYEGPPTANGKPGIHHVLARAYKDVIIRYKTMRGFYVERKAGWDTHGLPVELQVEKALKISGKQQIENIMPGDKRASIEKFNQECKTSVMAYRQDWEALTKRMGYWLDLEHPYITYDPSYIESVWWVIQQVWDKELIYKGHKVVPHCPRCETALSSHEVAQGYKSVADTSVYVKFKVTSSNVEAIQNLLSKGENVFILSWTTTPWTLPGNVALAIGKKIAYQLVKVDGTYLIVAAERSQVLGEDVKVLEDLKGEQLIGTVYEPLFPGTVERGDSKTAWTVLDAAFVTTTEGTGVVHTAVMYGEDDYQLGATASLPKQHTVDTTGKFLPSVPKWAGKFVKSKTVESEIITDLKERDLLFKVETYTHDYPFCWRCSTPLLYYAKDSWFIKMSAVRDQLIKNNQTINWVPAHLRDGRFGEWLKDVKDWAISRERYWGTPLPIWECSECKAQKCVGAFSELGVKHDFDPHRPFVDDITLPCEKCKRKMQRVPEVLDVWFDSGAMPYAQWHYPFVEMQRIDGSTNFPADYIAEAIDQTRGWFYTLLAVSTLLGKGVPYKNVISLAHILDAKGQKMSKSKGNVVEPNAVMDTYGADALRLHLFSMNQAGDNKLFDVKGVDEVVKKTLLIFWNVVTFYETHVKEGKHLDSVEPETILDKWALAELAHTVSSASFSLEKYDPTNAVRRIQLFITDLSTWYLRLNRSRLREGVGYSPAAAAILRYCIWHVSLLLAPFAPFIAESVFQKIRKDADPVSVHLCTWPNLEYTKDDEKIVSEVKKAGEVIQIAHALRKEKSLKVRQPLQSLATAVVLSPELEQVVSQEVNVMTTTSGAAIPQGQFYIVDPTKTVALNFEISEELLHKGLVRELARHVNDLRKAAGLTVKDLVDVEWMTDDQTLQHAFIEHAAELRELTRSRGIKASTVADATHKKELVMGGARITIGINT